jgi:protein-arginine kinase activator protein McsA
MDHFPVCTHCGFTFGEYRLRGLLGCPHCYAGFGEALQADLAWLHQALASIPELPDPPDSPAPSAGSGNGPGRSEKGPENGPESLARWREELAAAVRSENYEEAARLNRLIRDAGPAGSGSAFGLA